MFQPEEHDRPRPEDFAPPYFFFSLRDLGKLSYVTRSLREVLGFEPVKVLGRPFTEFLVSGDPLNAGVVASLQREIPEGQTYSSLCVVRDVNGNRRMLYVHMTGFRDRSSGQILRKHNIARDVTDDLAMSLTLQHRIGELRNRLGPLSDRDQRIAEAATQGKTNERVAEELAVSIRTVERRRKNLRQKFGVDHVAEIVALVAELKGLERIWENHSTQPWLNAVKSRVDH